MSDPNSLSHYFCQLEDPRIERGKIHSLHDLLIISVCALLCGAEGFVDMEEFGKAQRDWLQGLLELPNGIPSHDTFGRVFAVLDPMQFAEAFTAWTQSLRESLAGEIVALDGKTLRRSGGAQQSPVHLVSAWAAGNRLVLGQLRTAQKSNEITAVPELLRRLELAGCIVTLDAMGCQKTIAREIHEADADYVLALKANHEVLHGESQTFLDDALENPAPCPKPAATRRWKKTTDGLKPGATCASANSTGWPTGASGPRCAVSPSSKPSAPSAQKPRANGATISDLTGVSGLAILRAILEGERDTRRLAALKHPYVRKSPEEIAQALEGDYREEHLFALRQALELYEAYQMRIAECDTKIQAALLALASPHPVPSPGEVPPPKPRKTAKAQAEFALKTQLEAVCGVDLTALPGFQALSAQILISEIGLDMSRWKTEKHFCSWLRLSPGNRISGGKRMKSKPHKGHNRAAQILRVCAQAAIQSKSALGAFGRRLRARLDAPKAIKALAHKLARLVYRMLKSGQSYADAGELYYEHKYRDHLLKRLHKQAALFGFQLTPAPTE